MRVNFAADPRLFLASTFLTDDFGTARSRCVSTRHGHRYIALVLSRGRTATTASRTDAYAARAGKVGLGRRLVPGSGDDYSS